MFPFGKRKTHGSQILYFRSLKGLVGMLRDPGHTDSVFDIEDGLSKIEATKIYLAKVRSDPRVAVMMAERYLAPLPDVTALDKLPPGTLGKAFARHIIDHGFDPDYYRKIEVNTDLDWVMMRMRQNHDLWHVMTGIKTDPIGELSLKAFELAQTRRPMAAVIAAGGVFRYLLATPDDFGEMLEGISRGYQMGKNARPFLACKWEEGWHRPLADWRDQVGLFLDPGIPCAERDSDEDAAEICAEES